MDVLVPEQSTTQPHVSPDPGVSLCNATQSPSCHPPGTMQWQHTPSLLRRGREGEAWGAAGPGPRLGCLSGLTGTLGACSSCRHYSYYLC